MVEIQNSLPIYSYILNYVNISYTSGSSICRDFYHLLLYVQYSSPPQFGSITADRRNFHLSPKITQYTPRTPFACLSSPHAYLGPTLFSSLSFSLSSSIFSLLQFACFVDPPFTIYLYSFTHPPGVLPQSLAHYPSELYCLCFSTHKVSCACLCRFAPETTSLPRNYYYTRRSLHNPLDALIIDSTGSLI